MVSHAGKQNFYLVVCNKCGSVIGSSKSRGSSVLNWNNANKIPKDVNVNNFILTSLNEESLLHCNGAPWLRGLLKQAKELYACLVETNDEHFRSRVQELADSKLDEVVKALSKKGYIVF